MLLLSGALLTELTDYFLAKPRGLGEDIVQSIEHLSEGFCADRAPVGHSCRKDYVIRA
jgi:hypothetical protein